MLWLQYLKNKRVKDSYALFARAKACLYAAFLLPADLSANRRALFALFTLFVALFNSPFRLLATARARLAALPPELFPLDLRLDFPADLLRDLPPDLRLDFPADLLRDLPPDLREPLLLEAIISPTSE